MGGFMKTYIVKPHTIGFITAYAVQAESEEQAIGNLKALKLHIGHNPEITDISGNKVFVIMDIEDAGYDG